MDKLVFVQDSSNCTTTDPFQIFKRLKGIRLQQQALGRVEQAARSSVPGWRRLDCYIWMINVACERTTGSSAASHFLFFFYLLPHWRLLSRLCSDSSLSARVLRTKRP